jgi:hypothetical protein
MIDALDEGEQEDIREDEDLDDSAEEHVIVKGEIAVDGDLEEDEEDHLEEEAVHMGDEVRGEDIEVQGTVVVHEVKVHRVGLENAHYIRDNLGIGLNFLPFLIL